MQINQARNDEELKQMLLAPLKEAVKILMKKILETNKQAIIEKVYNPTTRSGAPTDSRYINTYEFEDAWDTAVHTSRHIGHDIQGDFFYRPSYMETSNPPSKENHYIGQHHGINDEWGDAREYLADIIYQGLSGPAYGNGPWRRKRDAFNELVKIVGKRNFNKWMIEAMEEVGLKVQSHGGIQRRDEK